MPCWICVPVRGWFQIRTSSTVPWKKPAGTPVLVSALPIAAWWALAGAGVKAPTASVRSRMPSR